MDYEKRFARYMVRNEAGRRLEKHGLIKEAIEQYELNVSELAEAPNAYIQLRILYTKLKRYDDAIRICHRYLVMCESNEWPQDSGFVGWIDKLEAKKRKAE